MKCEFVTHLFVHTRTVCVLVAGKSTWLCSFTSTLQVKAQTLGSQEDRATLFSSLLSVATSAEQLATLAQLLKLWPTSRWGDDVL